MAKIFVSYNRETEPVARALVGDVQSLGHTVWFDQELSGGQAWWDQILGTVRECDVFIFVLNPQSLTSPACMREYGYAADLDKPILPVLVSGKVSTNLLPPALSKIQYVDYRKQDRDAAFRLARALTSVPPAKPLPDPLPVPPEVPISYLGRLSEQLETTSNLSYDEQSAFVIDLRRSLRDPWTSEDTRTLLERLRRRRDLYATIADEIDELLRGTGTVSKALPRASEPEPASPAPVQKEQPRLSPVESTLPEAEPRSAIIPTSGPERAAPTKSQRLVAALSGAVLGTIVGVLAMSTFTAGLEFGLLTGVGGAIAGAISGTNRREIIAALIGAAAGWILVSNFFPSEAGRFAAGGVFGAPPGAILGAIAGLLLRKSGNQTLPK